MKVFKFPNGMECVFKRREDLKSVTVSVWVRAGAAYETDETRGIAHFLEHVIFNGSENLPPGKLDFEVELMGGEINAATSYDYTYFYINVPVHHWRRALELLAELVLRPLLSDDMVEKEKPIVLEEITRSKDNPQEVFLETFMEKLYSKVPYRFPILGFEETVSNIDAEKLKTFYTTFYTPDRMVLSVVGDLNETFLVETASDLFSFFRSSSISEPKAEEPKVVSNTFTVSNPAVAVPNVIFGWRLPPCGRHDIYFEVLDSLLSSGRTALLYRELREKGIAYGAYSSYQGLLLGSSFYILSVTEKIEETEKALKALIKRVLAISEEEFEFAKSKLFKAEMFSRESGETEADLMGYALSVIRDKGYYSNFFNDLKRADYRTFKERISFLEEQPLVGYLVGE